MFETYIPSIYLKLSKIQSNLFFLHLQDGSFQVVGELSAQICSEDFQFDCFQIGSLTTNSFPSSFTNHPAWMDEWWVKYILMRVDASNFWQLLVFVFVSFCG